MTSRFGKKEVEEKKAESEETFMSFLTKELLENVVTFLAAEMKKDGIKGVDEAYLREKLSLPEVSAFKESKAPAMAFGKGKASPSKAATNDEGGCEYIFPRGKNIGEPCGSKKIDHDFDKYGCFCKTHGGVMKNRAEKEASPKVKGKVAPAPASIKKPEPASSSANQKKPKEFNIDADSFDGKDDVVIIKNMGAFYVADVKSDTEISVYGWVDDENETNVHPLNKKQIAELEEFNVPYDVKKLEKAKEVAV